MAPATPTTRCGKCKNAITRKAHLLCSECGLHYHLACMGYEKLFSTMDAERKSQWKCHPCRQKTPEPAANDPYLNVTMTRGSTRPSISTKKTLERPVLAGGVGDEAIELSADLKKYVEDQMNLFTQNLLSKIDKITSSISSFNSRFNAIEQRISTIEERLGNSETLQLANERNQASDVRVNDLVATVDRLTRELNDREQELLLTEVEISGIPETSGENPVHIATIVGSKLGVQVEERDVISAVRVGARRDYASVAAAGSARAALGAGGGQAEAEVTAGQRPLVVRLQRRAQRDELLRAARVRRNLDTAGLNLPGPTSRFYINERLTKSNRQLFKRVREEKNRLNWKFAWTKNGSILVRRDLEAPVMRIRTEADIAKVFVPATVSGN
ncbi:hypothetical protein NE865_07299 [Phthorimaea operculella]|nr:hypothetical protein NE865_07299 [Phthorimaea operculella]